MTTTTLTKPIPLLDLAALHAPLRDNLIAEITRVVDSQKLILGEDVKEREDLLAEYCGTRFAIACASASDALSLPLLVGGIGPTDHVLTAITVSSRRPARLPAPGPRRCLWIFKAG